MKEERQRSGFAELGHDICLAKITENSLELIQIDVLVQNIGQDLDGLITPGFHRRCLGDHLEKLAIIVDVKVPRPDPLAKSCQNALIAIAKIVRLDNLNKAKNPALLTFVWVTRLES